MIGKCLGDFEILDEIGRGGMGVVYRARQISLNRDVALKVLPAALAEEPSAAARFSREAQNMARLQHPNAVDVIAVGEEDGVRYFVMQLIRGRSLQELLSDGEPLDAEQAASIAGQVADALAHAHAHGVIHRDIKPANILVDQHGRAVVTDFGIAKTAEGVGLTMTGQSVFTPEYVSPEVAKGNPMDGRADIYSLAVTLYHMVTGHAPFSGATALTVAMKHVNEAPLPPSARRVDCPEWLESTILRGMAKDPSDRFASAAEFADALRAAGPVPRPGGVHGTTVTGASLGLLSQDEAFAQFPSAPAGRRHWLALACALLGIGLIVAGAALLAMKPARPRTRLQRLSTQTEAIVRAVSGMSQDAATEALGAVGLRLNVMGTEHHETFEAGCVAWFSPGAGSRLANGETVDVIISLGPRVLPSLPGELAPWTRSRAVTEEDLSPYSNWDLTLMRNEIYARHGRRFESMHIRQHFLRRDWYRPDPGYSDSELSLVEDQNAATIRDFQTRRWGSPATAP